ncbi:hypothetical protein [Kutzneria sp. 744]|uniref:hypothetical protein n=1 Tax=Kutzneria sp. (strain 744) TaxID=345341 RepID=UPI0004B6AF9A|nr:hypothetical protein [Kutzneria sp. 744]
MPAAGFKAWSARHGHAILATLVVHELAAGTAFTVAGQTGAGSLLWAAGAGLALAYLLATFALRIRASRRPQLFVVTTVLLAATTGAAVAGVYGVANLLGLLGMLAVMAPQHHPQRHVTSIGHAANARNCDERSPDRR